MPEYFNRFDPMNQSMYLNGLLPYLSPGEVLSPSPYRTGITTTNPNAPKLAPQPKKDGFYKTDRADDGKISFTEKLKAFAKGGTYNMVKGMFFDQNGFSIKRTILTAGAATTIALTGPIGAVIAGGVGLVAAATNFAKSTQLAMVAKTDQQAREAYEGIGEGASTALLSVFGGYKGVKGIKKNFSSHIKGNFFKKLSNWKLDKNSIKKTKKSSKKSETTTTTQKKDGTTTQSKGNTATPTENATGNNPSNGTTAPEKTSTAPPKDGTAAPATEGTAKPQETTTKPKKVKKGKKSKKTKDKDVGLLGHAGNFLRAIGNEAKDALGIGKGKGKKKK